MMYKRDINPIAKALAAVPFNPKTVVVPPGLALEAKKLSRDVMGVKKRSQVSLGDLSKASDSQVKAMAKSFAYECKAIINTYYEEHLGDIEEAQHAAWCDLNVYVENIVKVEAPDSEKFGINSSLNRLMCPKWWRRRLRKKAAIKIEKAAIEEGYVHLNNDVYCSERTEARRATQRDQNSRILENINVVNEMGQEYTLKALSDLSVSNPTLRRIELMTRIKGFEDYAKLWGDSGEFYTITCPSRMHKKRTIRNKHGKVIKVEDNPKYDKTTPKQAQKYLTRQWEKARAKLHRAGVDVYGFRVVEPQHDGTPHWHLLLFTAPCNVLFLRSVLLKCALQHDAHESGAQKYRFKPEAIKTGINPKTGREYSAAGYIAKYISKAIDGYGIEQDLFGNDAAKAARRIEAWASTWNIRQFQQVGGASVTVWRELRRLGDEEINGSELLERARRCANEGDWCGYCQLNWFGEVSLMKQEVEGLGMYGDDKQARIYGVEAGAVGVVTRAHTWEFSNAPQGAGRAEQPQAVKPWTGVNNCTRVNEDMLKQALTHFNNNYKSVYHPKVQWVEAESRLSTFDAFKITQRFAITEFLESRYEIKGGFELAPEFVDKLRELWQEQRPRELLMEEFEEIEGKFGAVDWGEYPKFAENDFSGFAGDWLFGKYSIIFDDTEAGL